MASKFSSYRSLSSCVCVLFFLLFSFLHPHSPTATSTSVANQVKAALYGTNPQSLFLRHNRDKSGYLDLSDFKRLVRTSLRVRLFVVVRIMFRS